MWKIIDEVDEAQVPSTTQPKQNKKSDQRRPPVTTCGQSKKKKVRPDIAYRTSRNPHYLTWCCHACGAVFPDKYFSCQFCGKEQPCAAGHWGELWAAHGIANDCHDDDSSDGKYRPFDAFSDVCRRRRPACDDCKDFDAMQDLSTIDTMTTPPDMLNITGDLPSECPFNLLMSCRDSLHAKPKATRHDNLEEELCGTTSSGVGEFIEHETDVMMSKFSSPITVTSTIIPQQATMCWSVRSIKARARPMSWIVHRKKEKDETGDGVLFPANQWDVAHGRDVSQGRPTKVFNVTTGVMLRRSRVAGVEF